MFVSLLFFLHCLWEPANDHHWWILAPSSFQMQTLLFAAHDYVSVGPQLQPFDLSSCHHPYSWWGLNNGPPKCPHPNP